MQLDLREKNPAIVRPPANPYVVRPLALTESSAGKTPLQPMSSVPLSACTSDGLLMLSAARARVDIEALHLSQAPPQQIMGGAPNVGIPQQGNFPPPPGSYAQQPPPQVLESCRRLLTDCWP